MNKIIQTNINNTVVIKEKDNNIIEVISKGRQGISGKSAYTIAVENGFKGTEEEWLLSLKGDPFTYSDFTPEQLAGLTGPRGATGYTYTPKVDTDGNLSWTNNGNLVNPTTVNIKGPKGDKGDTGLTGDKGETGYYFQPHIDEYYNLSWTNNGGLENPELINIKGPKGDKGNTGTAATISIGTVLTGEAGTSVSITNSGSTNAAILDFVIPKGDKGDKGDPFRIIKVYESIGNMNSDYNNPDIPIGSFVIIETGDVNNSDNSKLFVKTNSGYSFITDLSGSQGIVGPQGIQGEKGDTGQQGLQGFTFTPVMSESGILSWINNGNLENPKPINLMGPQGPIGETGPKGEQGLTGDTGPQGESAIISEVNATIDNNIGIPSVTVDLGGTELNRTFTFSFKNIKGEQGIQGIQGEIGPQGLTGNKGDKGDTGEQGPQGISVTNAEINFNNGHLILTLE